MSDTELLVDSGFGAYNQWSLFGFLYLYTDVPDAAFTMRWAGVQGVQWPRPSNIESLRFVFRVMTPGASASFKLRIRSLGIDYDSEVVTTISPIYTEVSWQMPQMPGNGAAWTGTRASYAYTGFEAGLVFVSGDELRCNAMHVYVLNETYPQWTVIPDNAGALSAWQAFPIDSGAPLFIPTLPYTTIQEFNGDISYIESSLNGDISTFPHDGMGVPFPTNIDKFKITALVKNVSAAAQTVTPILRLGGNLYRGGCDTLGTVIPPDDIWHLVSSEYISDPTLAWPAGNPAGGPWTLAQINSAEIGLENTSGGNIHCTTLAGQIWCMPTPLTSINLFPASNGTHTDFVPIAPNTGEAAWEDVYENPPDDATSYIAASASSGPSQYSTFNLGIETIAVYAGAAFTLALKTDGVVWAWGENSVGQVGNGTIITPALIPSRVVGPGSIGFLSDVIAIEAGETFAVALKSDGTVWCWGDNWNGQLGNNSVVTPQPFPTQVLGVGGVGFLTDIVSIAAGSQHTLALKNDGTVYGWGRNDEGELGDGTFITPRLTPVQVIGGDVINIIGIACGQAHSLAVRTDGTVWSWGENNNGQLGDNTVVGPKSTPVQVTDTGGGGFLTGITAVSAGFDETSIALQNDGTVWCWGRNDHGQVGVNDFISPKITPRHVVGPGGVGFLSNVISIAGGVLYMATTNSSFESWCWGFGLNGALGDGLGATSSIPVQVLGIGGIGVLTTANTIACGTQHTVSVQTNGLVYCWGQNTSGELGDGTVISPSLFPLATLSIATAIAADERIYSAELRCRVRLGGIPHSTAKVVPVLRHIGSTIDYIGKPITIESTGGTWFDVKWDYFNNPNTNCPWGTFFGGPPADGLHEVRNDYEWGLGVIEGAVDLTRVRVKIGTCRNYAAAPPPLSIDAQITNAAAAMIARANIDGTLYAVTEFSVGIAGYDPANPGTVIPVNPADLTLGTEIWRGPLTHLQYNAATPPPWTVQYWCRVPRGTGVAQHGIGEIGLWAKILWSPFAWEIDTYFLFAIQHQPCQVKHEDSVHEYVVTVTYP